MEAIYYTRNEFQIIKKITEGSAMTEITKVKDKLTNEYYIIKKLSPSFKEYGNRLKKEYDYLTSLNSVNIVRGMYYTKSESDNLPMICMEYIEGKNIEEYLNEKPQKAQYIFTEVFRVLNYIHEKGIGHGDIKFNNILINQDGNLKFIDFGLATSLDTEEFTVLKSLEEKEMYLNRTLNDEEKNNIYTSKSDFNTALKMFRKLSETNAEINFELRDYVKKFELIDNLQMCTYENIKNVYDIKSKDELTFEQRQLFDKLLNWMPLNKFKSKPTIKKITFEKFEEYVDSLITTQVELMSFYSLFIEDVSYNYKSNLTIEVETLNKMKNILKNPKYMSALNNTVVNALNNVEIEYDIEDDDLPF